MTLQENLHFFRESVRRFHTTGSLVPSSSFLAKAVARPLGQRHGRAWQVLEVGPGTGVFTRHLIRHMGAKDHLDVYELNQEFCSRLETNLRREDSFRARRDQVEIFNKDILHLPSGRRYDLVVCSLPFNNFTSQTVAAIMKVLYACLKPGASLVYFEYLFLRGIKSAASSARERERLQQVEKVLNQYHAKGSYQDEVVWANFPPALVRKLTKP